MSVSFSRIPSDILVPLFYVEFDPSQANNARASQRALLIGGALAAGTAPKNVPVQVSSLADAKVLAGRGSMLAQMVDAFRQADSYRELWMLPVADAGAGVAAAGTVVLTGPATQSGTLALYVGGVAVLTLISAGDTSATIATALAAAVTANPDLPVTATAAASTVTLTARHKGLSGNDIDLRLNYRGAQGGEAVPAGVTATITAMSGGATDPDITTALASLGDTPFEYVALAYSDTTNLDAVKAEWGDATGRWSWARQLFGHVFAAKSGTVSALGTFGLARNDQHVTIVGMKGAPRPAWMRAAAVTAVAGASLAIDPARPLQTLAITGELAPAMPDRFTLSENNILLHDGISVCTTAQDGTVSISRLVTSYQTNAYGQADNSYQSIETPATLAELIRRMRTAITSKYGRHKLADDGTRFGEGQAIVTPSIIKGELVAQYGRAITDGLAENIASFIKYTIVERDSNNANRVNILYAPDLINQLNVFAVNAQFRLQYPAGA